MADESVYNWMELMVMFYSLNQFTATKCQDRTRLFSMNSVNLFLLFNGTYYRSYFLIIASKYIIVKISSNAKTWSEADFSLNYIPGGHTIFVSGYSGQHDNAGKRDGQDYCDC